MSDQKDQKLEALLRSRRVEPARPDLAEQIICKAQGIRQHQPITQWLTQLFAEFSLPRPAYVLAGTLIFGAVVGFTSPLDPPLPDEPDPIYVQSFLYADEDLL